MKIRIETFSDLFAFCKRPDITLEDMRNVINLSLNAHLVATDKDHALTDLQNWWAKYKDAPERPLLIKTDSAVFV